MLSTKNFTFSFIEHFYYLTWFFTLVLLKSLCFFLYYILSQTNYMTDKMCLKVSLHPYHLHFQLPVAFHRACCQGIQLLHKMFSSSKLGSLFTSFLCFYPHFFYISRCFPCINNILSTCSLLKCVSHKKKKKIWYIKIKDASCYMQAVQLLYSAIFKQSIY